MQQGDVLRHQRDHVAQARLGGMRDVLAVDQDAAAVEVVEALQQREQCRLAAARGADQAGALAGTELDAELVEHAMAVGIGEGDVFERHGPAAPGERLGILPVLEVVWLQQGGQRLREARRVLGDVDQRDGEIARGVEDGEAERADQHDLAAGDRAALPQHDRPGEQADGQHDRGCGMQEADLFEVEQAGAARRHLLADGLPEAAALTTDSAKAAHQQDIGDDVGQLALDPGCFVCKAHMQG